MRIRAYSFSPATNDDAASECVHANEDDISVTLPRSFGELLLRVFTREGRYVAWPSLPSLPTRLRTNTRALRFFGLVQLGYREVLKRFDNALLPGSVDNPEDDDVDEEWDDELDGEDDEGWEDPAAHSG